MLESSALMLRRVLIFFGVFLAFSLRLFGLGPLGLSEATMTLPVSLEEMTVRAGKIFVGRCVAVDEGEDAQGLPASWVTFEVVRSLKGVEDASVTIKHFGTPVVRDSIIPDLRPGEEGIIQRYRWAQSPYQYQPDEEVILFLYPDSQLGFTSPIGYGQGLFRVTEQEDGRKIVQNRFGNLFLGTSVRNRAVGFPALSTGSSQVPIEYHDFINAVEGMMGP